MKLLNDFFHIVESERIEEIYVCKIKLNAGHIIYKAHFPGNPITPGVCLMQMVTECLERDLGKKLYVKEVKNIKFLSVLSPVEHCCIDVVFSRIVENGTECIVQAVITSENTQYAKMSLIYAYEPF
jgi:3-hydroxyacyl-[acyl-carrier-protein] dehydratase